MMQKSVKLTKPHTHRGNEYQPNTVLRIAAPDADWIVEQGRGVFVSDSGQAANLTTAPARRRGGCAGCGWK